MRSPGGYAVITGPDGTQEADTFTCKHCQKIVHTRPLTDGTGDAGGLCKCCMGMICGPCVDRGICVPWEKAFEKIEARDRFLRSAGL